MDNSNFDTLSQAINALTQAGYTDDFTAGETHIISRSSKKEYSPVELRITRFYRFDGMTDPQDDAIVFAVEAADGSKGTLVMSYSANHGQNVDLISKIPGARN